MDARSGAPSRGPASFRRCAGYGGRVSPSRFAGVFERAAAAYDVTAFPFFTPFGAALVEFAQIDPSDRVLDVGCGTGAALAPASRTAASATAVELSPAMAERAQAAAPGAKVIVGDAAELPFDDASFDLVLSSFVVFFMPDPTAALREWRRVLAPGGRIVMSTWGSPDQRWQAFERPIRRSFIPRMDPEIARDLGAGLALVDRFSEEANVKKELQTAGFHDPEVAEHAIEFVFPDEKAWWDWNWSHGSRMFLEALPEDAQLSLREQLREAMEQVRGESGFPRIYTALFSRAYA